MRPVYHMSAGPVGRSVRSCFTTAPISSSRPALCERHFHRSAVANLPRRRTFFTTNQLLQQDDAAARRPPPADGKQARPAATQEAPRRKPPLKNSLRRVAVVAQKGVPARASARAASAASADGSSTISAVCVAESFDMDEVARALSVHGFQLDPDGTGFEVHEVVHARGSSSGDIFVFPSGTVVAWALPPDVVTTLATRHLLPAAEDPHVERKEVEDLEFVTDASRDESTVLGDVIVLGTAQEAAPPSSGGATAAAGRLNTTLAKIAFSSGLARSTKLAVLETALTRYFESTRHVPAQLSAGGSRVGRRFILRKTGELLGLRAQLNHYNELTDSLPDIFWDSRSELRLETYYDRVGKALDVGVRIKTLNEKMNYAQEVVDVLRETSSEKHSTRLEWIIILLIAVEVAFELRRVFMEKHERLAETAKATPAS